MNAVTYAKVRSMKDAAVLAEVLDSELLDGGKTFISFHVVKVDGELTVLGRDGKYDVEEFAKQVIWPARRQINQWMSRQMYTYLTTWPNF